MTAADFAFALARIADPAVNSPAISSFAQVLGLRRFYQAACRAAQVRTRRSLHCRSRSSTRGPAASPAWSCTASEELEIVLAGPNAQILYWFAMPFTTPMAWEAVAYYDGKDGRPHFADHAVGTGPFRLSVYEKQHRFMLERNELWYGSLPAEADAPGAIFPRKSTRGTSPTAASMPPTPAGACPSSTASSFSGSARDIPRFNKFLQGYYDDGGIVKESFDAVVQATGCRRKWQARGMRLDKAVEPSIFYVGFNMEDPVLGAPAGERGRKLRQAMSLAVNSKQYLRAVPQRSRRARPVAVAAGNLRLRRRATRTHSASTT